MKFNTIATLSLSLLVFSTVTFADVIQCPTATEIKTARYDQTQSNAGVQAFWLNSNLVAVNASSEIAATKLINGVTQAVGPYQYTVTIGPNKITYHICKYFPAQSQVAWVAVTTNQDHTVAPMTLAKIALTQ